MSRPIRNALMLLMMGLICATSRAVVPAFYPTATLAIVGSEHTGDSGNIQVDFNGYVELINYGQFSSPASLASGLAAMFSRDFIGFGLYAKAGANGNDPTVITFQLTNGSTFGPINVAGPSTSFTFNATGFASSSATVADIGTVALQFNGATIAATRYGEGSTPSSIAEGLVQSANSSLVTVTSEGANLYLQSRQTGTFSSPYNLVFTSTQTGFSQPSFASSPASGQLTGTSETTPIQVYNYSIGNGSTSGYDTTGNMLNLTDSVMGTWSYGYDSLNRLTSGLASGGTYNGRYTCWTYDSFGNRTSQSVSATPCANTPPTTFAATYSASNQIASVSAPAGVTVSYDAAGDVTNDGQSTYLYDAEGRVCAVHGPEGMMGYLYNADGNRVGKGTITSMTSCDPTQNGYQPTNDYILDQSGGQMTEVGWTSGTATWQHTNVTANGTPIATYDNQGLHFYLNDLLGSRRVQTDAAGFPEQTCQSLPFGDQLFCSGSTNFPTEHHFTGKERDTESGLDYFGARYYGSSMGRFMSPDWSAKQEPVPYSKLDNPQSLNLYSYTLNNPLSNVDTDGHACSGILGNTGSGFCTRATEYGMIDGNAAVRSQTRFFAAASAVSSALADVNALGSSMVSGVSGQTASFLEGVGQKLQAFNEGEAHLIASGNLSGPGLDQQLVHNEQSMVQGSLDSLKQSNPDAYSQTISQINGALNPGTVGAAASNLFSTDKAYTGVLNGVRKDLGRNIDFSNQGDREAIGNALVNHVRQTGGCDVTGSAGSGCH